jgi:Na+/H+ antiporter NhaD/arsenite permease-like protein
MAPELAWLSLGALVLVIVASCTSRLNPGVLALVLAWALTAYPASEHHSALNVRTVLAGFPTDLFLTLLGVTLLFTQAQVNGTLGRLTHAAVQLCRGNAGLVPILFCLLAAALATIGAGNLAATALLAPLAMAAAQRLRIPAVLMAIMVAHGALAGALSPLAPTGVIANELLRQRLESDGFEWQLYMHNLTANLAVAGLGFVLFGGLGLLVRRTVAVPRRDDDTLALPPPGPLQRAHVLTLAVIVLLIFAVVGLRAHVGMTALTGAVLLAMLGVADEGRALRDLPWGVIVMVCGVTVLAALLDKTGGADRLTELIGVVANPATVTGVTALLAGALSVYSSTAGVVLPAFLPLVPRLVIEVGGEPLALASSIIIGGHLVDASPLSTVGAVCVACAGPGEDRRALFNRLLAWGLSMAVVAAVGCYWFL